MHEREGMQSQRANICVLLGAAKKRYLERKVHVEQEQSVSV